MPQGNFSANRHRYPMKLIYMDRLRAKLDAGPEWWQPHQIATAFRITWTSIKRTPGLDVPLPAPRAGYHRETVWRIALERQAIAVEQRKAASPSPDDLDWHEWYSDVAYIQAMIQRYADDATTIQELHDRAGVRPMPHVPQRRTQPSTQMDDTDDDFCYIDKTRHLGVY